MLKSEVSVESIVYEFPQTFFFDPHVHIQRTYPVSFVMMVCLVNNYPGFNIEWINGRLVVN